MLSSEGVEPDLLVKLYRAATEPKHWPAFLAQLGQLTGASSIALVMLKEGDKNSAVSQTWSVQPEATEPYGEYCVAQDLRAQRGSAKAPSFVRNSEALINFAELAKTEIFNRFMLRFGAVHGLFAAAENCESLWVSLSLYRGENTSSFDESELRVMNALAPHLQNAFKLHFRFAEMKVQNDSLESVLNMLGTGVFFLGRKGEILASNCIADRLIAEQDGLVATPSGLRCTHAASALRLAKLIGDSIAISDALGDRSGGGTLIPRNLRPPLQVRVSPLLITTLGSARTPAAVVFVNDPQNEQRAPNHTLRELFGLTPAESRVALLMARGESVNRLADLIGVSRNTVRSQVKSIYAKTGVNRQTDLIRLLLNYATAAGSGFLTKPAAWMPYVKVIPT